MTSTTALNKDPVSNITSGVNIIIKSFMYAAMREINGQVINEMKKSKDDSDDAGGRGIWNTQQLYREVYTESHTRIHSTDDNDV